MFNIYLECYNGKSGIKVSHYLEGYKTLDKLEKARINFLQSQKLVELGRIVYTSNGIQEQKYKASSYKVLDRFNSKAFFEYWS